jgi:hypothetical protein
MTTSTNPQPAVRPVHMGVFPTLGSLQDCVNLAETKLPITDKNELFALLMTYHNTLLKACACHSKP